MSNKKRVLFSTVPFPELESFEGFRGKERICNHNDFAQSLTESYPWLLRLSSFHPSIGLRFMKENIPEIDILEYPSWNEFESKLKEGYDVLGVSFHTYTAPGAFKMATMAKEYGIKEIWGGNYGIMTPGSEKYFNRRLMGTAEEDVAKLMGKEPIKEIKHPEIIVNLSPNVIKPLKIRKVGNLVTSRGCSMKCDFCPTPSFDPKLDYISLKEIEKILDIYKAKNISQVHLTDETFLLNKTQSDDVINLLSKKGFRWTVLTRADLIKGRVKELLDKGMVMVGIGLESMRESNLKDHNKGQSLDIVLEVIDEADKNNSPTWGTYIIGFENDTPQSIKEDIDRMANMNIISLQVAVYTPFPGTPVWEKMKAEDKITDYDWHSYDHMRLVWKHPHMSREECNELFHYARQKINKPSTILSVLYDRFTGKLKKF